MSFSRTRITQMARSSNQKIHISLDHMKAAARAEKGRRIGVCADETNKVLDALPLVKYDPRKIHHLVKAVDDCIERGREERKKPKSSTLYLLSNYLDQRKFKKK